MHFESASPLFSVQEVILDIFWSSIKLLVKSYINFWYHQGIPLNVKILELIMTALIQQKSTDITYFDLNQKLGIACPDKKY